MTSLRSEESGRPRLRAAASASESALTVLAMRSLYLIKRNSGRFLIGNLDFRFNRPYGESRQERAPSPPIPFPPTNGSRSSTPWWGALRRRNNAHWCAGLLRRALICGVAHVTVITGHRPRA